MGFHADENQDVGSSVSSSSQRVTKSPEPKISCSLCGNSFARDATPSFPFCSERCRQIDLGHWLQESYGLPVEGTDDVFEEDV